VLLWEFTYNQILSFMQKLILLGLLAGSIAFVSCGGDETSPAAITIDGEEYTNGNGFYDYWGGVYHSTGGAVRQEGVPTHQRHAVYVTDGVHNGSYWFNDFTYLVGLSLSAPGSSEAPLAPGTYEINTWSYWNNSSSNLSQKKLGNLYLLIDGDTNREFYPSGEVTISGTLSNLTISYDLRIDYYNNLPRRTEGDPVYDGFFTVTGRLKGNFEEVDID